ncbi:MAG: hypothetical protein QOF02_4083 [Blastocatellia bacterium]|jgi:hypothetical protein|nr:hypothetical protein [Blastocatellia bacterium]
MKRLLLRGVWIALAMMSIAGGVVAQQTYGDPVGREVPPPLKIVEADDKSVPAGWKRFQFGEPVLFSAILPSLPEEHAARVSGSDGAEIVRAFYSLSGTALLGITYTTDLPGAVKAKTVEQQKAAFKNFIYGFAAGFANNSQGNEPAKFNITSERSVKVGGLDGYEKVFTLGDYNGLAQMVFKEKSSVILIFLTGAGNPAAERATFFSSFMFSQPR